MKSTPIPDILGILDTLDILLHISISRNVLKSSTTILKKLKRVPEVIWPKGLGAIVAYSGMNEEGIVVNAYSMSYIC